MTTKRRSEALNDKSLGMNVYRDSYTWKESLLKSNAEGGRGIIISRVFLLHC